MSRRQIVALQELETLLNGRRIECANIMHPMGDSDWALELLTDDGAIVHLTAENGRLVARTNQPLIRERTLNWPTPE